MKRAITLAGGGPTAGLHIGILKRLVEAEITFDVWGLSCIGAWVGLVYNQCDKGKEVEQTYQFFKNGVFRDDVSYSRFPINSVFGPDWFGNARALGAFLTDYRSYQNLVLPDRMLEAAKQTALFMISPNKWNEGDFNQWVLNHAFAANPAVRFMTSMMYLSNITGLSRILYPDSEFMQSIKFERLYEPDKPYLYHNAWNLSRQQLDLFSNKRDKYRWIDAASLCACSALPFIEGTVDIDGETYCEGALVDTVNFKSLIEDHPDLDEIWVSRIVDAKQVRKPENLHDNLANLCQLFAATVGEDDVKLFKYHVKNHKNWHGTIVEIHVDNHVNFKWSHSNLDAGVERGYVAADQAYQLYEKETGGRKNGSGTVRIINDANKDDDRPTSSDRRALQTVI
jgi:predicted acylesterase/phospholipase RssA